MRIDRTDQQIQSVGHTFLHTAHGRLQPLAAMVMQLGDPRGTGSVDPLRINAPAVGPAGQRPIQHPGASRQRRRVHQQRLITAQRTYQLLRLIRSTLLNLAHQNLPGVTQPLCYQRGRRRFSHAELGLPA